MARMGKGRGRPCAAVAAALTLAASGFGSGVWAQALRVATPAATAPSSTIARQGRGSTQPQPRSVTYTFSLNSFRISQTRSLHEDTDYAAIVVTVGDKPPMVLPPLLLGDVNNGDHAVGLTIANVAVPSDQNVAFAYAIVNASADPVDVQRALTAFLTTVATREAAEAPTTVVGRKAGEWQIKNIEFEGCDGTVAAGHHGFTAAQLAAQTSARALSGDDENPGNDSPAGCGSNSSYSASWTITAVPNP